MEPNEHDRNDRFDVASINRRKVLQSTAAAATAGLVGVPGFSGAAAGRGGSDPCDGCGALLAKYEWVEGEDDEDGEFVFEKGRESLNIDADSFDVTVTEWKEGEPMCVEFDSDIYEASCGSVKAGPDSRELDFESYVGSGEICAEDKYAISYFTLCIEHAFWQFDLGTGTIDDPPYYGDQKDDASLLWATTYGRYGSLGDTGFPSPDTIVFDRDDRVTDYNQDIHYDGDVPTSVTMEFKVKDGEGPVTVHLGSWEMLGPWERDDIEHSVRYDYKEQEFDDGLHTLTVDLPTV